ncbi:MAG: hypothetical protein ACHREM_01110 [Polyangiales bacterium]
MAEQRTFLPANPGQGNPNAKPGTREWAENRRGYSQMVMREARESPKHARAAFDEFRTNAFWKILIKRDGTAFKSFLEFIETPEPYGWGVKWAELRPILTAEAEARGEDGEKSIQLDFEAERVDARTTREHDDGGRFAADDQRGHSVPFGSPSDKRRQKRLSAAARAPEPARDLFRKGLLGVDEAAALGPADRETDPVKAALTTEAANAAVEAIKGEPAPKTGTDRRRLQRKANEAVRGVLSRKKPDPEEEIVRTLSKLTNEQLARVLLRMVNKFNDEEFARFITEAKRQHKA